MNEPLREVTMSPGSSVYVSDAGCLVIKQDGDNAVYFFPEEIDSLLAAILALRESAAAKYAAMDAVLQAEMAVFYGKEGA